MPTTTSSVTKTVTVDVSQERAFEVFTTRFDSWWPRTHHTGEGDLVEAGIEPHEGGRWWAKSTVGEETWGRVLVWDPPNRVVLDWQLSASFSYDEDFHTDLEVRFVAESDSRTRVELEHRDLDHYGDQAEQMRNVLGSDGGWTGIIAGYAAAATAT